MLGSKYLLAAVFAAIPFATHAVESTYTFDSISDIEQRVSRTLLTGILVDSTTTTILFTADSIPGFTNRCERLFGFMVDQPGTHTLSVTIDVFTPPSSPAVPNPAEQSVLVNCKLHLKP